MINGQESFWMFQERSNHPSRPKLDSGKHEAEVVIVGAGISGLWTAYWLLTLAPGLSVMILEAKEVGHGASGRNGGWLSSKPLGLKRHLLESPHGSESSYRKMREALKEAIPSILEIFHSRGYEIDAANDGFLSVAHTNSEASRLKASYESDLREGSNPDLHFYGRQTAQQHLNVRGITAAVYNPHGAVLNPAKMVFALAEIVESLGGVIYEHSRVQHLKEGAVHTKDAVVYSRARVIATEGYSQGLGDSKRWLTPIMSSMIVTEPLPDRYWESTGWTSRSGVSGSGHRYFYSQKTADNRIAFGGRGLPYKFGSRLDENGQISGITIRKLTSLLRSALDVDADVSITHSWCGMLGVPRDWTPSVSFSHETGTGILGGYVGQGLPAAYVAAGSLAHLILEKQSDLTTLPWIDRPRRQWEVEPLRFIGAYAVYGLYQIADSLEHRTQSSRTSVFAKAADVLAGR